MAKTTEEKKPPATIEQVLGVALTNKKSTKLGLSDFEILEVYRLASQGLQPGEIMSRLGRNSQAAGVMMAKSWEFKAAYEKGAAVGIDDVTGKLYETAMKGNVVAMIFYLKNTAKWSDNTPVPQGPQITNNHVNITAPEIKSPEDWALWVSQQQQIREPERQAKIAEMEAADIKLLEEMSEAEIGEFAAMIEDEE